ncbi:AraC family transcriptional regulator [Aliikangiella marina]|uniref:AraC family transcriptional regulator n=1 Tax=Aliikangiella marina TaxID=1712262 RepID=A0A545THL1_9GAMM|nr:AraC family transcriptional regulator [Aliikangiella marina]TQV76702.1 AraC family transcriptional regulator [Aliikangiella marina]
MNWDLLSLLIQLVNTDKLNVSRQQIEAGFVPGKQGTVEKNAIFNVIGSIIKQKGHPSIGLNVGKLINPNSFHGLGYLFMTARDLMQACERICEFPLFFHNIVDIRTKTTNDKFLFYVDNQAKNSLVQAVINEATLGIIYQYTNWLNQHKIHVNRVNLKSAPLSGDEKYLKHFDQRPNFNSTENAIEFSHVDAKAPLISSEPEYHHALYSKLKEKHDSMSHGLIARARQFIRESLSNGFISRHVLAKKLSISEKTLERRLGQHNCSYRELIDTIRLELAQKYLLNSNYSIEDIARKLGYSDRNTFSKAYKKWTGTTPRSGLHLKNLA